MKPNVRILTALLSASMLLSIVSCGDTKTSVESQPSDTSTAETTVQTETTSLSTSVPAGTDFGGITLNLLNGIYFDTDGFYLNVTEESGDIVNDAVYKRNLDVMNAVNVNFNCIDKCLSSNEDEAKIISSSVLAGSNDYDIIFGIQYNVVPLVLENMFVNLYDAPYIDTTQPWWSGDYIKEVSVGDSSVYFLSGDITLGLMRHQSCAYYNKTLYENLFGDPNEMYNEVLDGRWTLDSLSTYATASYSDLNGDSKFDEDDQYGAGVITANLTDHFTYDSGVRATTRDENGIPQLTMNNEHTVAVTEKLHELYYNNTGIHIFPPDYTSLHEKIPAKFKNQQLTFMFGWFYIADYLRDMETDYGVIPFPKYDENQENYISLIHDVATLVCLPATCDKLDTVSAVMELMAFEGYNTVYPAYYEVALKTKYVRDSDDVSMRILDMIHDSATTDFAFVYNYALNGIGLIERDILGNKNGTFASVYAKKEEKTLKLLDELVALYTSLE